MRRAPPKHVSPGDILARPARGRDGQVLVPAGSCLSTAQADRIAELAAGDCWLLDPGEVPPTTPEHLDRYVPDDTERLLRRFGEALDDPLMQQLCAAAITHARHHLDGGGRR